MNNLSPVKDFNREYRGNLIKLNIKDRAISNDITGQSTEVSNPIS